MPEQLANLIGVGLEWIVAVTVGLVVAFWVGLVVWAWRDIRTRSADIFAAMLAALLVLIFGPIGVLLYLLLRPKQTLAEQYDRALEEEALLREIEQTPACPHCGRPVEVDWQYCPTCETELRHPCPQCGHLLDPAWKRCPHCGTRPGAQPQPQVEQTLIPPPQHIPPAIEPAPTIPVDDLVPPPTPEP